MLRGYNPARWNEAIKKAADVRWTRSSFAGMITVFGFFSVVIGPRIRTDGRGQPLLAPDPLDRWVSLFSTPVILIMGLALVAYAIRDLQRTKSFKSVVFGFYVLGVFGTIAILMFAESFRDWGLIQTFGNTSELTKFDYIYFSIITWTTVGYGDLIPSPSSRIFAAEEALFGYIYMAAYVGYTLNAIMFLGNYNFDEETKSSTSDVGQLPTVPPSQS